MYSIVRNWPIRHALRFGTTVKNVRITGVRKDENGTEKMKFERVSPESVGIRSEDIREFLKEEFHSGIQLHSFMLIRHGKVAAEGWYKPYSPDARHAIYSFSKTFTQIAIGFAEQEGILSLDEKLVDLFPEELPDTVSENLALADIESLLTMSCGHETELTTEDIEKRGGNWVKAFFEQEFKYPPHTMFQYNTTGTDLLCLILLKKTGQTLTKFLTPRLFEPLEIRDVYCSTMGDRVVSPDAPYSQVEAGGWGYHMRTEDLAKFIWFLMQRGVWEGKRLLREEWFDRAFVKQIETDNEVYAPQTYHWKLGYCYQCWCNPYDGSWRADGLYGQFGYVIPEKDAVMIMTAASVNTEKQLSLLDRIIVDRMEEDALPENPKAWKKLRKKISKAKIPAPWAVRQSGSEPLLSEKTYRIDNPERISLEEYIGGDGHFGHDSYVLETLSFAFEERALLITFTQRQEKTDSSSLSASRQDETMKLSQTLKIGLDGKYRKSILTDGIYFSAGKWVWSDEMELEVRYQEALSAAIIRLVFDETTLTLTVRSQIPEEIDITKRKVKKLCGER